MYNVFMGMRSSTLKLKLMCVQDQTYLLNVAVVDDLPADMILGRDLPVLTELLHSTQNF